MQLVFLAYEPGVEGPAEILHQMNTKKFSVDDDSHGEATDVQWGVVVPCSLAINNHIFKLF